MSFPSHITKALRVAARALLLSAEAAPAPVRKPARKRSKAPEDETPDQYRERVGRCPRGYRWNKKKQTCLKKEAYKAADGADPSDLDAKRAVPTGDEAVDDKLDDIVRDSHSTPTSGGFDHSGEFGAYSGDDIMAYSKASAAKLSEKETDTAYGYSQGYASGLASYTVLNTFLNRGSEVAEAAVNRINDEEDMDIEFDEEKVFEKAVELSNVINKQSLPKAGIAYRGCAAPGMYDEYAKMAPGTVVQNSGFWSTSASEKVASNFQRGEGKPVLFKIKMPKGAKVLAMADFSNYPDEQELLLNHGSKLRFVKSRKTSKGLQVTMEYVEDGEV